MISAPTSPTSSETGWRRIFTAERVALFLLILAAALPYLSSLTFGFVYDDLGVIVEVPSRHTWPGVAQAWVQSYWGNPAPGLYRPVAQFGIACIVVVLRASMHNKNREQNERQTAQQAAGAYALAIGAKESGAG